jgi:dTMP kinase
LPSDPFEARSSAFHDHLRKAFLALAAADPGTRIVIDADRPVDQVAAAVWDCVARRLQVEAG